MLRETWTVKACGQVSRMSAGPLGDHVEERQLVKVQFRKHHALQQWIRNVDIEE